MATKAKFDRLQRQKYLAKIALHNWRGGDDVPRGWVLLHIYRDTYSTKKKVRYVCRLRKDLGAMQRAVVVQLP